MKNAEIELHRRANSILLESLDLPAAARKGFLDRQCVHEPEVRRLVETLLGLDESELEVVERPVLRLIPTEGLNPPQDGSMVGQEVGPYRIGRELGRGGTGAVYLAERVDGVFERRVAIKVLKRGMDTDEIIARFRTERRILAQLAHPNIAELLEGGALEDGRPYFIMPFIEGDRIDRHCAIDNLQLRARIELFLKVCEAVAHAHRNLVVHRDLKPSNILVGSDGEPKLLDFGIAKVLDPLALSSVTDTAPGLLLLTPAYASPEQWAGGPITTATDIFTLGVVLFEILTESRPEAPGRLREDSPTLASQRVGEPQRKRALRGDLDTIVAKAMRSDPLRRYPSVEALAEDLRLHLKGHPVMARADTWRYRLGKLVRRRRREMVMAFLVTLVVGWLLVDRQLEQRRAALQREQAAEVSEFLLELYRLEGTTSAKPTRELLDRGAARLLVEPERPRDLQADLMDVLGEGYAHLGFYGEAESLLQGALALRRAHFGSPHAKVAESLLALAQVQLNLGRREAAEGAIQEAAEISQAVYAVDDPHQISILNRLGLMHLAKGNFSTAEGFLRQALAGSRALESSENRGAAAIESNLGLVLYRLGSYEEAVSLLKRALATSTTVLGRDHPQSSAARANLAAALSSLGEYGEAETLGRQVLELAMQKNGEESLAAANSLNNLAVRLQKRGKAQEAEEMLRRAEGIWQRKLGDDHHFVAKAKANRARALADLGRIKEALTEASVAYRAASQGTDSEHPTVLSIGAVLAEQRLLGGDLQGAEDLALQIVQKRRIRLGERHPDTGEALILLAEIRLHQNDGSSAEVLARNAIEILSLVLPQQHPVLAKAEGTLGAALLEQERYSEAESLLRAAVTISRETQGSEARQTRIAQRRLDTLHQRWQAKELPP